MSFIRRKVQDAAVGVAVADGPDGLEVLKKPGCAAALWRRQMPRDVLDWLEGLPPEQLPRGRVVTLPGSVEPVLGQLCEMAGTPDCIERDWLIGDIADLAQRFAQMMDAPYLRLRLDAVQHNACRKFHIDALTARLICTYRGQGTQYGISTNGQDPQRVFQVATGAPIVLRGTDWPERPASGLLHRSPPIEGTGETRLLLVLDPIFEAEPEA